MIDFGLGVMLGPISCGKMGYRNDPKIWRWTRQNDLINFRQDSDWLEKQASDPSIKMYNIETDRDPDFGFSGVCGLTSINWQNRNAEFSLYIVPHHQGEGLSTPALLTLFHHGFTNMGLSQIWGETFENNKARKIFAGIGMKEDGVRRQFYWKDGKFWDAIMISFLAEEFYERHGKRSCFGQAS